MLKAADAVLSKALASGFMSVGIEYQEEKMKEVAAFQERLESQRAESISRKDEELANLAWILDCFATGVHEFLSMWTLLKRDQMESAWDALVTAQECLQSGLRFIDADGLSRLNKHLHAVEILLFPPCSFLSSSIVYGSAECSICHQEAGECDHVSGKLYMGEMCHRIVRKILSVDHVAVVDHPQDKRCRLPPLVNGEDRCSLTHRKRTVPTDEPESAPADLAG
jgi:hypothetical protein